MSLVKEGKPGDCKICGRFSKEGKGGRCKTCFAIWYDGETDPAEVKRHSLNWEVDDIRAYRKSDYGIIDFDEFANSYGE